MGDSLALTDGSSAELLASTRTVPMLSTQPVRSDPRVEPALPKTIRSLAVPDPTEPSNFSPRRNPRASKRKKRPRRRLLANHRNRVHPGERNGRAPVARWPGLETARHLFRTANRPSIHPSARLPQSPQPTSKANIRKAQSASLLRKAKTQRRGRGIGRISTPKSKNNRELRDLGMSLTRTVSLSQRGLRRKVSRDVENQLRWVRSVHADRTVERRHNRHVRCNSSVVGVQR